MNWYDWEEKLDLLGSLLEQDALLGNPVFVYHSVKNSVISFLWALCTLQQKVLSVKFCLFWFQPLGKALNLGCLGQTNLQLLALNVRKLLCRIYLAASWAFSEQGCLATESAFYLLIWCCDLKSLKRGISGGLG